MKIINSTSPILKGHSFKRAIRPEEEADYHDTVEKGKAFLGIKNLALIMHSSSFPIQNNDLFIGSHITPKAKEVNQFLKLHGFDSIQLGPPGLIKEENPSPYITSINAKNYLYSDMEKLDSGEYAHILKKGDIKELSNYKYEKYSDQTNFHKAFDAHDILFETAYNNLMNKVDKNDPDALRLNKEFEQAYKKETKDWLDYAALFEHFEKKYGTDDFFKWPDKCQNMVIYLQNPQLPEHENAVNYLKNIEKKHGEELEIYKFKQFIIDKQEKEFAKENPDKLNYISDAIIGFSMMDYWSNQEAFLKDYRVGTPYGGEGKPIGQGSPWGKNQTWDIPVINPQKLFNEDGSLGIGGKMIYKKFKNLLDSYENIRIDHAIGLIDPWVYDKNRIEIKYGRFDGEPQSIPEHIIYKNAHGANLNQMGKPGAFEVDSRNDWNDETKNIYREINKDIESMPNLDPEGNYPKIIAKILLPLFKEKGVNVDDAVWESLGCDTPIFNKVYKEENNLPEITSVYEWQSQFRSKRDWHILGCHDHPPFAQVANENFFNDKNCKGGIFQSDYLIGGLYPEESKNEKDKLIYDMGWDTRLRVITKFQELFRYGEKIQLTFMDFFGMDKTYNKSGTQDCDNWKLRLTKNYKENYYKTLEDKDWHKIAINVPEMLKRGVISKIYTQDKSRAEQDVDFEKANTLVNKLEHYEKILYEKSNDISLGTSA